MCELLTIAYMAVCSVVLIWYGLIEAVHIEIIDLLVKVKSHNSNVTSKI
jgi:hypothetical protein